MEQTCIFSNDFSTNKCETKIKVVEKTHDDGKEFYNIMYEHTHIEKDERIKCLNIEDIKNPNPFFDTPMIEHFGGDIIVKNELTEVLIKFLTMADEELSKKSGNISAGIYRIQIMQSIANFWD